ncbi:hypothetical protein [Sinanaerobacter chloroacetimidivorans]|uniref:Uncharacterized protein n=1 Tax=Sinanaerobacter chloroacetimidivorans TaxID=2818044 RepID=A0A8J7VZ02_9FIRM|nr:hypothetical protein [Sinanaerobacter chloroacetimidivorans]MBR0597689.1 hypothetical protein [Sinanaerobacter chloroacetimidivorans]
MNNNKTVGNVHNSMYKQIQKTGIATPVQVLLDLGILSKEDYERWRFGKVDYLERVCKVNLSKLSFVMREIQSYAAKNSLKGSWTFYKQWGQKDSPRAKQLRFSKSGGEDIEKAYATHYLKLSQICEQKN